MCDTSTEHVFCLFGLWHSPTLPLSRLTTIPIWFQALSLHSRHLAMPVFTQASLGQTNKYVLSKLVHPLLPGQQGGSLPLHTPSPWQLPGYHGRYRYTQVHRQCNYPWCSAHVCHGEWWHLELYCAGHNTTVPETLHVPITTPIHNGWA